MDVEPDLPQDPSALRQLVLQLLSTLQDRDRQIGQLSSQVEALKRRLFGRRSEKIDSSQLILELGAWLAAQSATETEEAPVPVVTHQGAENAGPRSGHGRRRLPENLPRQRREYHPSPEACLCRECEVQLTRIGEEVSEQLEYVPASFFVIEHARIQYACPQCQGNVVIGTLPVKPIEKGLPGPGLLAHVLTSKYADHRVPRMQSRLPVGEEAMQCCVEDEGRPLGIGLQSRVPNHLKLLWLRARVVSVEEKARLTRQVRTMKTNVSELPMTCRKIFRWHQNRGAAARASSTR